MSTVIGYRVYPRLYRDSVTLMAAAAGAQRTPGVVQAAAMMATPGNRRILADADLWPEGLEPAPDDLLVVVRAESDDLATGALDAVDEALAGRDEQAKATDGPQVGTIREAKAQQPAATLATVSVPGSYAPIVVEQALAADLHVFCFSDNVSIEDEVRLKSLARERGRLLMGPDCGTAIVDGVPLGFANAVRTGPVGIVAASGTGAQEVSTLLDRWGVGVAQLIGVGGRDLSADVQGVMTHAALDLLADDDAVQSLMVVSKPPAGAVGDTLLARLETLAGPRRPVIACLLGRADAGITGVDPLLIRGTLEGAAIDAAVLAGAHPEIADPTDLPIAERPGVLGLFTGGTLASEAKIVLARAGVEATIHDLGDDQYTAGRPHPMIDPAPRTAWLADLANDDTVGVLLVDLVLGHGAHPDPAGALADAVDALQQRRGANDRAPLVVVASVTGTDADPQPLSGQVRRLRSAGIVVAPCNASAARVAGRLSRNAQSAQRVIHRVAR